MTGRSSSRPPNLRQKCVHDLAREVLSAPPPETTVQPAKISPRGSSLRRVLRGLSSFAAHNWAVAASLLIVLVGGELVLARIKAESADALAQVTADALAKVTSELWQLKKKEVAAEKHAKQRQPELYQKS